MDEPKTAIEKAGIYIAIAGVGTLAAIFLVVMVNGSWPETLGPVRAAFRFLGDTVGDWAIVFEFWIFAAPGLLIYWIGHLFRRRTARHSPPTPHL